MIRSIFHLDPSEKLSSIPLFINVLIIFFALSVIAGLLIVINSELELDLSVNGFNYFFFTVMKVPLSIFASGLTILGIISIVHRSSQTHLQINKLNEQNVFTNYYKHREDYTLHFQELMEETPDYISSKLSAKEVKEFYRSTFPFNSPINLHLESNLDWLKSFDKDLVKMSIYLLEIENVTEHEVAIFLLDDLVNLEVRFTRELFRLEEFTNLYPRSVTYYVRNVDTDIINSMKVSFNNKPVSDFIEKLNVYAVFITNLLYLGGRAEATLLYGTDFYRAIRYGNFVDKLFLDCDESKVNYISVTNEHLVRYEAIKADIEDQFNRWEKSI